MPRAQPQLRCNALVMTCWLGLRSSWKVYCSALLICTLMFLFHDFPQPNSTSHDAFLVSNLSKNRRFVLGDVGYAYFVSSQLQYVICRPPDGLWITLRYRAGKWKGRRLIWYSVVAVSISLSQSDRRNFRFLIDHNEAPNLKDPWQLHESRLCHKKGMYIQSRAETLGRLLRYEW